jgi:hypothetical protein
MNSDAVAGRLSELGLHVPAAELEALTALVADMHAASAMAQQPLPYACEPACVFALPHPATG